MATSQIPGHDTSQYARHYAAASDAGRLAEIFSDSYRIALSSKNPDTARDRFPLDGAIVSRALRRFADRTSF